MKSRALYRYLLFILILSWGTNPIHIASAQDDIKRESKVQEKAMDEGINRPVIEYKSGNLRDPFLPLKMVQEEKAAGGGQRMDLIQVGSSVGDLKVQGIIWGGRFPQAIINDKVLTVGDTIGGVKLLSIDKNGITLSSSGGADNSTVSMKTPAFKKGE